MSGSLLPLAKQIALDNSANPGVGYKFYTYEPGTLTQKTTYQDAALTSANTNPVIANARGEVTMYGEGLYRIILKTASDVTVWDRDNVGVPGAFADALRAELAASSGASLIGWIQSGTGALARTAQAKLREIGVFASDFSGYDPTGVADSTAAIQAAINAANTAGTYTVYIPGKPRVTAPLTYSTMLALVGVDGGDSFTNSFDTYPNRIRCGDVTGYLFDQPDTVNGSGGLSLTNLCLDGRTAAGARSTTLQGFVKSATTSGTSSFYLRIKNCILGNGDATTPMLDLTGQVFSLCENTMFSTWPYGYGHKAGAPSILGTTITFNKCYWNSLRQVGEFLNNVTDATYNDCVIESCVVGVAAALCSVTFNSLYSENMGYDASGTGITTGLTPRSFGIADAPAIAGNVAAVFTCRHGKMVFNTPTLQNTTGGRKWFDGIGRGSAVGGGGRITINDVHFAAGTISTLFAADGDTPSSRATFEYHLTASMGSLAVVTHADARMVTKGRIPIQWSGGNIRPVEVDNGLFTVPALAVGGYSAVPTDYPSGGALVVGDKAYRSPSTQAAGKELLWVCTTAGTTGAKWDTLDFMPLSVSATVAAAGTLNVPVPLVEVGTTYVYEIMGTVGGTALQYEAHVRIAHLASGSGVVVTEGVDTGTTSVSYAHGSGITITNNNAVSLTYYARLISVGRTHA
jgi:hypothetical protein